MKKEKAPSFRTPLPTTWYDGFGRRYYFDAQNNAMYDFFVDVTIPGPAPEMAPPNHFGPLQPLAPAMENAPQVELIPGTQPNKTYLCWVKYQYCHRPLRTLPPLQSLVPGPRPRKIYPCRL